MSVGRGGGGGRRRGGGVTALLVLTALAMMSLDLGGGASSPLDGPRSAVGAALGPVERGVGALAAPLTGLDRGSDQRVADLQSEVDRLTAQARRGELDRSRSVELDALLRLTGAGQYLTVPALVVAVAPTQQRERTVTIDAGRSDGVAPDMTVVNGDGLVGRVVAATSTTATVQLTIDAEAQLGTRLEGSLQLGIARGDGAALRFELLDPLEPMSPGDRVVTFGSPGGRPYVAGVPVGELSRVRGEVGAATRTAVLVPYVDFSALDLVAVVVEPPRSDPRDAVLPPAPTVSAGPAATAPAGPR